MSDHHRYCSGDFRPDDIVISGIAGRFPQCKNIGEFKDALLTSKNILVETGERYEKGAFGMPFNSCGSVQDYDKFDANYFGYSSVTADTTEPTQRMILEVSYEAIVDAGYDPTTELRGCNIGVYTAISHEDAMKVGTEQNVRHSTLTFGYLRTMAANRCSYHFDFKGPSFTVDSACSSSFVALWAAFCDIREGRADAALVTGGELCLDPFMTSAFIDGGIVSAANRSSPFDENANGMVRSEAITAFFLQKASVARRAYANIFHIKHVAGGYLPQGMGVPSYAAEVQLFQDMLKESKIKPEEIQFVETHGTGTPVGDPIEISALETVYCKDRIEPLYVGSVKSNAGHSEATAGQTGAIKAIIAFETGIIAPNYNFKKPNPNCEALIKGTMKVVSEPLPLKSKYIPVNSFGFGGAFVQAIFKKNSIEYSESSQPEDLPRLVLYPGTTKEAVQHLFDYIKSHPELRSEFFALLNKLSFTPTKMKSYRGYALYQNENPVIQIKNVQKSKREVWFVMTGMGCQWPGMGLEMMQIKIFADSMKKSASVLKTLGIDLFELLKKDEKHLLTDRSITPAFVAIASIQIALVDVLKALKIYPDRMIGHSTGELICAYADGCCTAEQTILSAYWRGACVESANLGAGLMAAVGLTWEEAVRRCPDDVYPACHNAEDSVTISGLKEPLEKFVSELQKEGIFARVVNAYGYAFHCRHVWPAAKELKKVLSEIVRDPKPRTERWVSTSYPEEEWDKEDCKIAGAEYFVHNLMSVVRFNDVLKKIPSDACTIEIGPHFLLQSILKRSIGSDASYIGLMKRNDDNNIGFFMESLGELYLEGLSPNIENLYRPLQFPVPKGTPMISDVIQWDHSQSFYSPKWKHIPVPYVHKFKIGSVDKYLLDHFIDGRSLFPATGYVYLALQAAINKVQGNEDMNFVIEDFKIHRPTFLNASSLKINFTTAILESSGKFEITESDSLVASGRIYEEDAIQFCEPHPTVSMEEKDSSNRVPGSDIYDELRIAGYEYGPAFRRLAETSFDGKEGFVEWKDNWITFMDALLLFYMFSAEDKSFVLPTGALSFKICPKDLKSCAEECEKQGLPGVPVNFHKNTRICRTAGLEIKHLQVDSGPQHKKSDGCIFEEYTFVPYVHSFVPLKQDENLIKYMIACNTVIDQLQINFNADLTSGKFFVEDNVEFDVDKYINEASIEMKLLTSLKTVLSIGKSNGTLKEYKEVLTRYVQDIGNDIVNNLLVNDRCLKFIFEVVLENSYRKINILEINNNFRLTLPSVVEVTKRFGSMKLKNKTLVCKDIEKIDESKMSECDISFHSLESLPSVVPEKSQNVIISAIGTNTQKDAQEHVHLLSTLVEEKGFILLFHKNCVLPPENLLASLASKKINLIPQSLLESWFEEEGLVTISRISHNICGNLYLLKPKRETETGTIVSISEDNPAWLEKLKNSVVNENKKTWVVSEDCSSSGIVGMINCLRHEPNGENIRCVFIPRKNKEKYPPPPFNFEDPFFKDVLEKDLLMNIYKDGCWGSFRSIEIDTDQLFKVVDHSYVDMKRMGDLSTLVWMESPIEYTEPSESDLVHVYYSALNFRDVMLATGKISLQTAKGICNKYIKFFL